MRGKKVLDVGLGAAANAIAALERHEHIEIVSLERDLDALSLALARRLSVSRRSGAPPPSRCCATERGARAPQVDAARRRRARDPHGEGYDTVFHDPFSPEHNAELWTVDCFGGAGALLERRCWRRTAVDATRVSLLLRVGSSASTSCTSPAPRSSSAPAPPETNRPSTARRCAPREGS